MNKIASIVAIGRNHEIGKDNQLLWKIKDDLKLFRKTTQFHTVIHGRKSFESIGKPLPNRTNIVITRNTDYKPNGAFVCHSLEEAISLAQKLEQNNEIMILGGAEIYRQSMELIHRLYISHVGANFPDADAYFPEIDFDFFSKQECTSYPQNEVNEYSFKFCVWDKV